MTTFDKREEGFEKQFAHDADLKFRANARRNRLLGLWAAEKLGLPEAEAAAYAKEVVVADLEEAGDDDVFRKIRKDFDAKGMKESDHQIRRTMDELMAKAAEYRKANPALSEAQSFSAVFTSRENAELAARDEVPQIPHRWREAVSEGGHVPEALLAGLGAHRSRFAGIEAQRLFAHDVLAPLETCHRDGKMRVVRGADDDRIDRRVGGDVGVILRGLRN